MGARDSYAISASDTTNRKMFHPWLGFGALPDSDEPTVSFNAPAAPAKLNAAARTAAIPAAVTRSDACGRPERISTTATTR